MANHMVFKVNHVVQGRPWIIPMPYYYFRLMDKLQSPDTIFRRVRKIVQGDY
jgi:hypothetical protein